MHTIEKKIMTKTAPGGANFSVSVGNIGYTEQKAAAVPGLLAHPDFGADDTVLVIESFYNYLASGSINNRRQYFKDYRVSGIGAVLLKKLGRLALAGKNTPLGISKEHDFIYVTGTKRQAWDNYRAYGFRPVGANAMTWRVGTQQLMECVGEAKVEVADMPPQHGPRGAKIPSLFAQSLNASTQSPGAARTTDDPADATLRAKLVLGGVVSADGFKVSEGN